MVIQAKNNMFKNILPYLLLAVLIVTTLVFFKGLKTEIHDMDYNEFINNLTAEKVEKLSITPKSGDGVYVLSGKLESYKDTESFKVVVPLTDSVMENVLTIAESQNLKVTTNSNPENSSWLLILINVVPTLLLLGAMFYLFTKLGNNGKGTFDFGRSKAKLSDDAGKTTFANVAGLKEEKEEVQELIDFLKNPKKFQKLGARIPKGVLLVGPPGTGKTLLARAVAGEAKVPFYYRSGSDFVELFVGVGASRVRDMFKQAKQTAPCLIFIDELML